MQEVMLLKFNCSEDYCFLDLSFKRHRLLIKLNCLASLVLLQVVLNYYGFLRASLHQSI
jgi:hypothetical protein